MFNREFQLMWSSLLETKPQDSNKLPDWWDEVKKRTKEIARNISKSRQKLKDALSKCLYEKVNKLMVAYDARPSANLANEILDIKKSLDNLEKDKVKGESKM